MPVTVHCPTCDRQLVAPDELIGKLAACPQCKKKFPVTAGSGERRGPPAKALHLRPPDEPSDEPSAAEKPPEGPPPPAPEAAGKRGPGRAVDAGPDRRPERVSSSEPAEPAQPAAGVSRYPPGGAVPPPDAVPVPPARATPPAARPQRRAATARLITAAPTDTRIQLGADGQLPQLVLASESEKETTEKAAAGSPWLLMLVLAISFGASAAMLLLDFGPVTRQQDEKVEARRAIKNHYLGSAAMQKPYQKLLRAALQAHYREDYNEEKRLYRQVMDLLHSEANSENQGLTGQVRAAAPPNDRHLEKLLARLIDD